MTPHRPLQVIPNSITIFTDALVSLDRIEALLFEAEKFEKNLFSPHRNTNENKNSNTYGNEEIDLNLSVENEGESVENELPDIASTAKISLRTVTAIRGKSAEILKNITFTLGPNGLTLIIGGNASGKTSLLLSMLNELVLMKGDAAFIPPEVMN
jgi:ABC-type multidrug transport system fused ATPase/permease subunit